MSEQRRIVPFDGPIDADVVLPGSKSMSNRVLLAAAVARGSSSISGILRAEDTEAMLGAIQAVGAIVESTGDSAVVTGRGASDDPDNEVMIDAVQSGTTSRFMLPVLAATPGNWVLTGDDQLLRRPFGNQIEALRSLGADIAELGEPDRLPLQIRGRRLAGGRVLLRGDVSSQFLSGLLLAAPLMTEGLAIEVTTELVSRPYVEMTASVMRRFGVDVGCGEREFVVAPGAYRGTDIVVEPDASAASYFFGAASVMGGRVKVLGLGTDSIQGDVGFVDVLETMGATVTKRTDSIEVSVSGRLAGVTVDMSQISDTAQTLAAVAATASGVTEVGGIGFIQGKETRRVDAVVRELNRLGIKADVTEDGFRLVGGVTRPAVVDTYDDHRMAMSFALLGLVSEGISIDNPACVTKTFPRFWEVLESLRPERSMLKVVALDGPAGSGKSTVATALAAELGVRHFDTGAMYRAVAYAVLDSGVDVEDVDAVADVARRVDIKMDDRVVVDGVDATTAIRSHEVTAIVSATSAIPAVRSELVRLQREWVGQQDGAVLDGRDIGTVVFPDAPVKAFLTASVEVRAERRFAETTGQTLEDIEADIERRDHADSTRTTSPLKAADDAIIIDTSDRAVADIVAELVSLTRAAWEEEGS
jgi:3-phosphoshikimate 1-carboxyvinyltransferase